MNSFPTHARTRLGPALALGLAALLLGPWTPALALDSQDCRPKDLTTEARTASTAMAARVARALDDRGARLALVARVGRNMQNYGLRYSHVGLITRPTPGAAWKVVHLLSVCGTDRSALHEQTLTEFFQDSPFNYESLVALPSPAWQAYLGSRLEDTALREAVFRDHYSAIAYPFNVAYQNSNGWVLDWLTSSEASASADRAGKPAPKPTRRTTIKYLQEHGYVPGRVEIGYGDRLGAMFTLANVSFVDHPVAERLNGTYSLVTVESILAFGCRRGWLERLVALPVDASDKEAGCAAFDFPPSTYSKGTLDAAPALAPSLSPSPSGAPTAAGISP